MSSAGNNLEIKGDLSHHPLAELLVEASQAELSGSFRLSSDTNKIIIYLREGKIVFAVSNSRKTRLFQILLNSGMITNQILSEIPEFTNDQILAQTLIEKEILSLENKDAMLAYQVKEIVSAAVAWKNGEWIFNPQMRIKENIRYETNTTRMFFDYARETSQDFVVSRFKSLDETFSARKDAPQDLPLLPEEGFVLSLFGDRTYKIGEIQTLTGLPDSNIFRVLYLLWLSGFLKRQMWNSAFSERDISAIKSAKLTLKKEAAPIKKIPVETAEEKNSEEKESAAETENGEKDFSVEEYLTHIENAEHYYEMLKVSITSELPAIKTAYFSLAQKFHPDKFHHLSNQGLQMRIQEAFTEIAKAYEVLKSEEKREMYDFKVRKYLESEKAAEAAVQAEKQKQSEPSDKAKAAEEFNKGFNLLEQADYEAAVPFLSRAVHLEPSNPRYQAYFGKALSNDELRRFQAEQAIQAAIKGDSENPLYRIMLVEFYIQYNLLKRAEGELQRLLKIFPDNLEAQQLLASLPDK